jgi:hypothetical protein
VRLKNDDKKVLEIKKEYNQSFSELMSNYGVPADKLQGVDVFVKDQSGWKFWTALILPYVVGFLLLMGLLYLMTRQVQGANSKAMSFGQSGARKVKPDDKGTKTFKDVPGRGVTSVPSVLDAREALRAREHAAHEGQSFGERRKAGVHLGARHEAGNTHVLSTHVFLS